MSSTSEPLRMPADAGWQRDARVISLVAIAHFVSHVHVMLLPPILLLVKDHFGTGYAEIALALTAYNVVSALLQTPAGFLVDRIGARVMLTAGLVLSGTALCIAVLLPGYAAFVIGYMLLGVANTVYHPADYSILSAAIDGKRMGKAFSVHTFAGYLGFGVTPGMVLGAVALWGWNGGFLCAAVMSFGGALLLMLTGSVLPRVPRKATPRSGETRTSEAKVGLDLLLSPPVLRNLLFFFCIAMANGAPRARRRDRLCLHLGHGRAARLGRHAGRGADLRDVAGRPAERHDPAQPRHDGARRHATRLVRQGVRLRHHRLQPGRHGGAARLRLADGSWPAAHDLRHRRGVHPAGAGHLHDAPQARRGAMDSLTPATPSQRESLRRRYGATGLPKPGPWNDVIACVLDHLFMAFLLLHPVSRDHGCPAAHRRERMRAALAARGFEVR